MANQARKIVLTPVLLILLGSTVYATLLPNVQATEEITQQKALIVLHDVVDLNTNMYTVNLNKESNSTILGLSKEEVNFNLTSSQGSLRARCSFVNNKLHQIYLSDYTGAFSLNQPATATLDMTKEFLEKYQNYTNNSFYRVLSSIIDGVDLSENITKTEGNIRFEVSVLGNGAYQNLIWTYVDENGVPAIAKNMVLSYDRGILRSFMDNWQLYTIDGATKLSSEEAVSIAITATKNLSYTAYDAPNHTVMVSNFKVVSVGNATLSYLNYNEDSARGNDPFTLYPSWYVPLGFDKVYPGSVTGAIVRIWADTGEVSTIEPMVYGGAPSPNETEVTEMINQGSGMMILLITATIGSVVGIYLFGTRVSFLSHKRSLKIISSKMSIALLCMLTLSSLLVVAAPNVNAAKNAEIYASQYGQTFDDMRYAGVVVGYIENYFQAAGYENVTNNYGYLTTKDIMHTNINYDQTHYTGITVFHYGHMNGASHLYDSNGQDISYSDIDTWVTTTDKHFFVWLWACNPAIIHNQYMPVAWAQRDLLQEDGYHNPAYIPDCFIGFYGASPSIYYGSFKDTTCQAFRYIERVYDYALNQGYTVHNALDQASQDIDTFHLPYDQSLLHLGFQTWWPGGMGQPQGWYWGWMRVYGNSGIVLRW